MIKKTIPFLLITMFLISTLTNNQIVKADTLQDYKNELAKVEEQKAEYERQQEEARKRAQNYKNEIASSTTKIDNFGKEISESREKIKELEIEIKEKKKEIEDLLSFLQITNGENVYLEYIFGAKDFTDFIYRTAIVEQLSNHNDNLIKEMNNLIEENKKLQKELEEKIKQEEEEIEKFQKMLKEANLTISNIEGYYEDIDAEIKAQKEIIKFYEDLGCELDEDVDACVKRKLNANISSTGFNLPTRTAHRISSEWGPRILNGEYDYHNGIDIAVDENTPVYASTFGIVRKLVYRSSCGGNIVYIEHTVNGEKLTTRYLHLMYYTVSLGDVVTPNTIIGYSAGGRTTGAYAGGYDECTFGAHLHFEIRKGWGSDLPPSVYSWNSYLVSVNPRNYLYFPNGW